MSFRVRTSERFCASDSDITFQSNDNVLFKLHKVNLQTHAKGFAPPDFATLDETVHLQENSATLELLFQFMYPERHPDLELLGFKILEPLAEAAEKYEVFAAMNICKVRMKLFLSRHPEELLTYGAKHDYLDIVSAAAPLMLHKSLDEMLKKLPLKLAVTWAIYQDRWGQVLRAAFDYYSSHTCQSQVLEKRRQTNYYGNSSPQPSNLSSLAMTAANRTGRCSNCSGSGDGSCLVQILVRLGKGVTSLTALDSTFAAQCEWSKSKVKPWQASVEESIRKIPTFDNFCRSL